MTRSSRRNGLSPKYGKFEHLEDRRLMALTTELAYDLNTTPGPAAVESLTVLGDAAYFLSGDTLWKTNQDGTATTEVKGFSGVDSFPYGKRMLLAGDLLFLFGKAGFWVSDGTDAGTIRIRDEFRPQFNVGFTDNAAVNDTLFFVAMNGAAESELWKSDGTPEGTARIPFAGREPRPIAEVGGKLVFTASAFGREFWATDGTEAGTVLLANATPGGGDTSDDSVKLGDKLLFSASGDVWETDGTPAGTRELQEFNRGPIDVVGASGEFAYFLAEPAFGIDELWRTDGSPNGLSQIWTFDRDVQAKSSVAIGDQIAFVVDSLDMQTWVSDGTIEGTMQVHASNTNYVPSLTVVENEVFIAGQSDNILPAIWKSDGTPEGTLLLRTNAPSYLVDDAVALNGVYLFDDGQLRRSNGTPEGSGDIVHENRNTWGSNGSAPLGFVATDDFLLTVGDRQLWSFSDPSAAPVKIWQGADGDMVLSPGGYTDHGVLTTEDKAYFVIHDRDRITSNKLWVTGGTMETTHVLHNFGELPGFKQRLAANGLVYFTDTVGDLWVTQGVPGTTRRILQGERNSKMFESAIASGNRVFFDGPNDALWVTEGTPETTRLVFEFPVTFHPPSDFAELNGEVYFRALVMMSPDDFNSTRLWRTDGTPEGTRTVSPPDRTLAMYPKSLIRVEDRIFFRASSGEGTGLFVTDGTTDGTRVVVDRMPADTLDKGRFASIGSRLYVPGISGELIVTEGTAESTRTLTLANRNTWNYIAANGLLFFQQADEQDISLSRWWRSDGTHEGTFPLTEWGLWSHQLTTTAAGNVFIARLEQMGEISEGELWKSDGTLEGTTVAAPIMSYLQPRTYQWPLAASLRGDVYYGKIDLQYGYEPWRVRAPDGDANFDGEVDLEDLNHVRNQFGYVGRDRPGDANGDGVVGLEDLNEVRNNFGGAPSPSATTRIEPARIPATAEVALSPQRRNTDAAKLNELLHTLAEDQLRDARPFGPLKRTARGAKSSLAAQNDLWERN